MQYWCLICQWGHLHIPSGKELDEFVCLLVIIIGCIFKVPKVIGGHQG